MDQHGCHDAVRADADYMESPVFLAGVKELLALAGIESQR